MGKTELCNEIRRKQPQGIVNLFAHRKKNVICENKVVVNDRIGELDDKV